MSGTLAWIGVAVLGALGSYARFSVGGAVGAWRPSELPSGTLAVNLTGAFALGVLTGLELDGDALLVLGTGLLGGYTTFSTWMVEAQRLGEDAAWRSLALYLALSVAGGLAAAGLGWLVGAALT